MTLALEGIEAGYGPATVLRDVAFRAEEGKCTALLGPNATGKTTLLRVAAGICRPRRGRVLLDGHDVTASAGHERTRRGLCFVPESRGVFAALSVRDNLLLFSDGVGATDGPERAFDMFPDLRDRAAQVAGTLSGGEQQMLALSRAVIQRPSVVMLDEVSLGLAPRYVERIFEFVKELVAAGAAVVVVDQYVSRSLAIADNVYMLESGTIAFSGPPNELPRDLVESGYLGGVG